MTEPKSATRRTGGVGAAAVPGPGIELTLRAGARDRAASPRRRRLVREHDRPHHVQQGDDVPREPVGPVVGGGPGERPPHHRRRRRGRRRRVGRHPGGAHPHRAAPHAARRRRSSCTTTRRTRSRSRRSASSPSSCTRTRRSSPTSSCSSTSTTARSTSPTLGADLADRIGDASVALLVSHGVIVTAPTMRRGGVQVGAVRAHVHAALAGAGDGPRAAADRADAPEAAEGVAGRAGRAGVLERRRARARARRTRRCWSSRWRSRSRSSRRSRASPPRQARAAIWLPEPERAERRYTVISVDDHIVEPPDAFEGRLPAKFADRAPRVVERDDGSEAWVYDGQELPERRLQRGRRPAR